MEGVGLMPYGHESRLRHKTQIWYGCNSGILLGPSGSLYRCFQILQMAVHCARLEFRNC